tara:strand:- start:113 stop:328 length:216 start_codon:yes stop_codon:yes gene_type:complete
MNLKPGDMLYYAPHKATGVLLYKEGSTWAYCLRSPLVKNPDGPCKESIQEADEAMFIEGLSNGTLQYFSVE